MKPVPTLLCICLLLCACASSVPRIDPMENSAAKQAMALKCRNLFPTGEWQLLHSIEATAPDGHQALLMGATVLSSEPQRLHCALMTIEGFVLFEASAEEGNLVITRAIAPFDSPALANGMMDDIRLIFFPPEATRCEFGRSQNGEEICRYYMADDSLLDMTIHGDSSWEIKRYDDDRTIIRTVTATDMTDSFQKSVLLPKTLKLTAHGLFGYELTMHLLEALPLGK